MLQDFLKQFIFFFRNGFYFSIMFSQIVLKTFSKKAQVTVDFSARIEEIQSVEKSTDLKCLYLSQK